MKKALLIGIGIVVLVWIGCGIFGSGSTPEDAAKSYIEKKFDGIKCDLSELEYKVDKKKENEATVTITGVIKYDEKISLVQEGGKWMTVSAAKEIKKSQTKVEKKSQPEVEKNATAPKASH